MDQSSRSEILELIQKHTTTTPGHGADGVATLDFKCDLKKVKLRIEAMARHAEDRQTLAAEWDLVAGEPESNNVRDVLLDGVSIKCECSAVRIGTGEALCYVRDKDGGFTITPDGKQSVTEVRTGKLAVIGDGYAIANYGPVQIH